MLSLQLFINRNLSILSFIFGSFILVSILSILPDNSIHAMNNNSFEGYFQLNFMNNTVTPTSGPEAGIILSNDLSGSPREIQMSASRIFGENQIEAIQVTSLNEFLVSIGQQLGMDRSISDLRNIVDNHNMHAGDPIQIQQIKIHVVCENMNKENIKFILSTKI